MTLCPAPINSKPFFWHSDIISEGEMLHSTPSISPKPLTS